jgi:hypothetical protein
VTVKQKSQRKIGIIGAAIGLICLLLAFGISQLPTAVRDPDDTADSKSRVVDRLVDERYLPVLNIDIFLSRVNAKGLPLAAEAIKSAGAELRTSGKLAQAKAVNVMIRTQAREPALHFTVSGDLLNDIVMHDRPAPLLLANAKEAGMNSDEGREAVRAYCESSTLGICS